MMSKKLYFVEPVQQKDLLCGTQIEFKFMCGIYDSYFRNPCIQHTTNSPAARKPMWYISFGIEISSI
jgi:hypothetical protein